jgi:hypothetical protein
VQPPKLTSNIYIVLKVDGAANYDSARKDGAGFWKPDTSKGRDISLPRFIGGCAIYANNLANLKSRCLTFVFNVAPTGYHAKPLNVSKSGVVPSHHLLLHFWVLVGFAAVFPRKHHLFP